ncbi:hypothetical protein FJY94_08820 [Candidatus Kaiserbacteria bacterium]|nr:hypothetical protein [Candidatus Kaiserbacteria bacterium]
MKSLKFWALGALFLAALVLISPDTSAFTDRSSADPGAVPGAVAPKSKKVKPGDPPKGNCDVTVTQGAGSGGTATITPAEGNPDSTGNCDQTPTTVDTTGTFVGTIDGVDANDSVDIGQSSTATVNCAGGTVSIGKNSAVTVTNTGTKPATVNLPGGGSATVASGSTTFKT